MFYSKKSLGQNFLIDQNIIKKIINLKNIKNKDVVEIGPGKGAITEEILKQHPRSLTIIEKDNYLLKKLNDKYKRNKSFSYNDRKGIKEFIISTFNSFNKGKLKNIKCDYSDLRYDRLAKKYRDIIES